MWLPTPIYEKIPQFWLLLGLLFFTLGLYIGFDFELIFFYLVLGFLCLARGLWIHLVRLRYRGARKDSNDTPADNGNNGDPGDTGVTPIGS